MVIDKPAKPIASLSKHPDDQEFIVDSTIDKVYLVTVLW